MTSKAKTAASNVLKFPGIGDDCGAMPAARAALPPSGLSPVARSQAKPAPAVASKFAEQHQVDPDEAYRDAVYAEIGDWLKRFAGIIVSIALVYGMIVAALVVL